MTTQKQEFPNSCAATSLLCAAVELGVTTLPKNKNYSLWGADDSLLVTTDCQKRIYQWTSNNPNRLDAQNWGYSMPSDIANCAIYLGLTVKILVYSTYTVTGLKFAYKDEWNRISTHPSYVSNSSGKSNHILANNERELKILAEWQDLLGPIKNIGAMHCVMVRPGGSVMEPDDGTDKSSIANDKSYNGMHGTGISIVVSK
jgi:hypothetical protein